MRYLFLRRRWLARFDREAFRERLARHVRQWGIAYLALLLAALPLLQEPSPPPASPTSPAASTPGFPRAMPTYTVACSRIGPRAGNCR